MTWLKTLWGNVDGGDAGLRGIVATFFFVLGIIFVGILYTLGMIALIQHYPLIGWPILALIGIVGFVYAGTRYKE